MSAHPIRTAFECSGDEPAPEFLDALRVRFLATLGQPVATTRSPDQKETLVTEQPDAQGNMWLYVFSPGRTAAKTSMFVSVGINVNQILKPYSDARWEQLLLLVLTSLFGIYVAGWLGMRDVVVPTDQILRATHQLKAGNLDVRIGLDSMPAKGEFARIADAFNLMAESLQQRQQDVATELDRSNQAYATLELVLNNMQEGLMAVDIDGNYVLNNTAASEFFDFGDRPTTLSPGCAEIFGLFLPGTQTLIPFEQHPLRRALQGEADSSFDILVRNKRVPQGKLIRCSYRPIFNASAIVGGLVVFVDITEQQKTYADLMLLRNAVARLNDIVLITEAEPVSAPGPRIIFVNEAFERRTGYSAAEAIGQTPRLLQGPDTDRTALDRIRSALERWEPVRAELLNYAKDGGQFWVELDIVPLADTSGWYTHWIAVERDITERKLAEKALLDSELRYEALFDESPIPMWIFDEQSLRFLATNDAAVTQYGYSKQEFMSMTLLDIRSPPEQARCKIWAAEGFQGEGGTWWHKRKDGSEFPVRGASRKISHGGLSARFVVIYDITDQHKAEQDVQEQIFTLQRAADAATAIGLHQTLDGMLNEVAGQACAVLRAHQCIVRLITDKDWAQAIHAVSLSEKYAAYRNYVGEPDGTGIYALVCESNRPLRLTQAELEAHPRWRGFGGHASNHPPMRGWLAVPLVGRNGDNIGVLQLTDRYEGEFTQQDEYIAVELAQLASIAIENARLFETITELNAGLEKQVEVRTTELARQEALFRALAEQAPQVIWTYERGRGVTFFNRAWGELVGGVPADWLGPEKWLDAIHPEDREEVWKNWKKSEASLEVFSGVRRLRSKHGTYRTMSYRAVPVMDDQGRPNFWVGIDADITELKAFEAALRSSNQELEAFSYSVSHDLRSPLNTIDGFSRLLVREQESVLTDKARHYLDRMQKGVSHMAQLIEDLLSLAQLSRTHLRHDTVDLSAIAHGVLEQLQQSDSGRVVSIAVQDGLQVQGDVRLIRVVMENLLGNAWKFTSTQARPVRIEVGSVPGGPGETVVFVRDNGVGFDMAYVGKLFNAFQRLHGANEFPGTGVGLAIVGRVVSRHGGRVWVEARDGEGATFYLALPKASLPLLSS